MENVSKTEIGGFWYLATPCAKYPGGTQKAFEDAAEQAGFLLKNGINVFCPITHSHPIHPHVNPSDPHSFWLDLDRLFMQVAKGMIICKLIGWEESKGIAKEIDFFFKLKKPIVYMIPNEIPQWGDFLK